jgi:hypothetical protein
MSLNPVEDVGPPPKARVKDIYRFKELEVGQSRLYSVADKKEKKSLQVAASQYGRRWGIMLITRVTNLGVRVYRVPKDFV